ncbi:MAG: hypothetical protein IKU45_00815 [Clostridia bacterium]|nr:hypothetical protein [Clostridia bacterium]
MRNIGRMLKVFAVALVACLAVCVFVACGNDKTDSNNGGNKNDNKMQTYNIGVTKGLEYGEISANPVKSENGGTLYEFAVTPKYGYAVKSMKVGGVEVAVENNKATCVLGGDCMVEVTYQRKTNEELESRRAKVLAEMALITGTYFKPDKDYDYNITSTKAAKIEANKLLQGMPYSNFPTVSYYQFIEDYTSGQDENGVYILKDLWIDENNKAIVGNNCADAVYWAWSTICSTIDCVVTGNFSEPNGIVNLGTFTVAENEIDKDGRYNNTIDITKRNGLNTMLESYAMCLKGDALMNATNGAGHIVMVDSVNVVYDSQGNVNGDRSYVIYYDQNAGYSEKTAYKGQKVMSSTENGDKWTFMKLFEDGYIPLTIKELMDDETPIAEETVKDSLDANKFTTLNVTRGYIESNYYFSKIRMEITDANGNTVFAANRFRDETNPKRAALSWFTQTVGTEYKSYTIYDSAFDMNSLATGTYHCKVTVWLASGNSYVVRDFDFQK